MRCCAPDVDQRPLRSDLSTARGYPVFRCGKCGKQFNERSAD
jgi:hypothetical protein